MTPTQRFIDACLRKPVDRPPVWMMRQAGRYLPEYRALRARYDTLTMMKTPELAAEITMQPVRRIGVDAAILYSDILIVPDAMGLKLAFVEGEGPKFAEPVRSVSTLDRLQTDGVAARAGFVYEAIGLIQKALKSEATPEGPIPLLGFAGAPFTVATYMVEGGSSEHFAEIRTLMREQPDLLHGLLGKITVATIDYLRGQSEAGVVALQLFDTWAGVLTPEDYEQWALPYTRKILSAMTVPTILFIKKGDHLLEKMVTAGSQVIGVDGRITLSEARRRTGGKVALQGNFDPEKLLRPIPEIEQGVAAMISDWGGGPGYIMNLGHGILPETPVEHARAFVGACQRYGG